VRATRSLSLPPAVGRFHEKRESLALFILMQFPGKPYRGRIINKVTTFPDVAPADFREQQRALETGRREREREREGRGGKRPLRSCIGIAITATTKRTCVARQRRNATRCAVKRAASRIESPRGVHRSVPLHPSSSLVFSSFSPASPIARLQRFFRPAESRQDSLNYLIAQAKAPDAGRAPRC